MTHDMSSRDLEPRQELSKADRLISHLRDHPDSVEKTTDHVEMAETLEGLAAVVNHILNALETDR